MSLVNRRVVFVLFVVSSASGSGCRSDANQATTPPTSPEPVVQGEGVTIADPGYIYHTHVYISVGSSPNAGSDADLWLAFSYRDGDSGRPTFGGTCYLGHGLIAGESSHEFLCAAPDKFSYHSIGGLTLVNGGNGISPDLEVLRIRVEGEEPGGEKRWLIADYQPLPDRRWLANDPKDIFRGPAMPIRTLATWQPLANE